jgi:hypothetical protein
MRRNTVFLLLFVLILSININPADAQATILPVKFSSLQIQIWPEYDKPEVLVIYRIILDPGTKLPARIAVSIPIASGEPNSVAFRDPADGNLYNLQYSLMNKDDRVKVLFDATAYEIQFEYYDPGLTKTETNREYRFSWVDEFDVNELSFQVQQPLHATQMSIQPSMTKSFIGDDGITYFTSNAGSVTAGTTISIVVKYQKSDDQLTAEGILLEPSAPLDARTTGRNTMGEYLPYLLGGLGLLALAGFFWWLWLMEHSPRSGDRSHRHRPKISLRQATEDENIYCHQCGQRAQAGDVFCRACGTKLRKIG